MDQTKMTAQLPTVDVEIIKRTVPEQNAEAITIHITATPSFDAAARWLLQTNLFPIARRFYYGPTSCVPGIVIAGQFRADSIAARIGIATASWLAGSAGAQLSGRRRAARY